MCGCSVCIKGNICNKEHSKSQENYEKEYTRRMNLAHKNQGGYTHQNEGRSTTLR